MCVGDCLAYLSAKLLMVETLGIWLVSPEVNDSI